MDKSWITIGNRVSSAYMYGAKTFIEFAYINKHPNAEIKCPCKRCRNTINQRSKDVYEHIIMHGFLETYTKWVYHGESTIHSQLVNDDSEVNERHRKDNMHELVNEALGMPTLDSGPILDEPDEHSTRPDEDTEKFFKLLKDAERELYSGCKDFSFLSFVVQIFHLKTNHKWSHTSFTALLQVLKKAFPMIEPFPKSYSEARKVVRDLGLDYKKIHACPNNCMLYRKEFADLNDCKYCHTSRWKQFSGETDDDSTNERKHKILAKVVRYFPLKQRLQRLFMSSKTASLMQWHGQQRRNDGILRHPADSKVWKSFDEQHSTFSSDFRNVRLGLSSDGFNPFRTMNISHSTWPVVLMIYNLPPWMCTKQPYLILSTLIDGPRGPGNNIDVYLQPLVDELKELWDEGIPTYDATSKQMFCMRAALLWTISDFPAYANLSGWSTKGRLACPCCNKETRSKWLSHGKKFCYMGHRRWLDPNHKFRDDLISFDGMAERKLKPPRLSGDDLLEQLHGLEINDEQNHGDMSRKRKRWDANDESIREELNWKKKSVFFQLPYWKANLIRHNLDVMHIEKNVCDNILGTLLNVQGKCKDTLKARLDLQDMGIRKALHPKQHANRKAYIPPACFTMSKDQKDLFCKVLKNVKVPDGYLSNISRHVNLKERTISGLKSHDNHIIMQQLLPLAIRKSLPKNVTMALIELSNFFRKLCSKTMTIDEFEHLQDRIALTLCHLEKIFPPSFFDVMEHLVVHLAEEAAIAGPVQFRWMYSIERFLFTLKEYVKNRNHPEGSIAEAYLAEECMTFCARYLNDVDSKLNRPIRNYEGAETLVGGTGRALGKGVAFLLDEISWGQAHRYVLVNTASVTPFREKHIAFLKQERPRVGEYEISRIHNEQFPKWFMNHVQKLKEGEISEELAILAAGPSKWAKKYSGYIVNGFRFHTKKRESRRNTQNSGVMLKAAIESYASAKDKHPISGYVTYYGALTDIFELRYSNKFKYILFKCDWVDINTGKKQDEFKFTLVNFNHLLYRHNRLSDEPFILASQAEQVWYVQDPTEEDWHVVMKMTPRDLYDMYGKAPIDSAIIDPQVEPFNSQMLDNVTARHDEDIEWVRAGVDGTTVDIPTDSDDDDDTLEDDANNDTDNEDEDVEIDEDESEADEEIYESDLDSTDEDHSESDEDNSESDEDED